MSENTTETAGTSSETKEEEELVKFGNRMVYPEIAEYFELRRKAQFAYDEAIAEAEHAYNKTARAKRFAWAQENPHSTWDSYRQSTHTGGLLVQDWQDRGIAQRAAEETYSAAQLKARALLSESKHPMVAWIANHTLADYEDYSESVLKVLPAKDTAEIWQVKENTRACGEFDRLFYAAEAAGVFSGKPSVAGREIAAVTNWISRNLGGGYVSDFLRHLNPVMKRFEEDKEKALADAKAAFELEKAEWQKLDEAHAENATRNRSEAAKAAWARRKAEAEESAKTVVEDDAPESSVHAQSAMAEAGSRSLSFNPGVDF